MSGRRYERKRKPQWVRDIEQLDAQRLAKPTDLDETCWLTQLGMGGKFRDAPRFERVQSNYPPEHDVSVVLGQLDVTEMRMWVTGRSAQKNDGVRYFYGEDLGAHEYAFWSSPTRRIPGHASIAAPVDFRVKPDESKLWWSRQGHVTLSEIAATSRQRLEGGHDTLE